MTVVTPRTSEILTFSAREWSPVDRDAELRARQDRTVAARVRDARRDLADAVFASYTSEARSRVLAIVRDLARWLVDADHVVVGFFPNEEDGTLETVLDVPGRRLVISYRIEDAMYAFDQTTRSDSRRSPWRTRPFDTSPDVAWLLNG